MDRHVPDDMIAARGAAPARRRGRGFRVVAGGDSRPLLRLWKTGFELASDEAPNLRGYVDLYEGAEHLARCLIVLAEREGEIIRYEFKQRTDDIGGPPVDFARDDAAPVALLPEE